MKHDFDSALTNLTEGGLNITKSDIAAMVFALKFTKKMMGEPSDGMTDAAISSYGRDGNFALVSHFKSMRDQAIKEIT